MLNLHLKDSSAGKTIELAEASYFRILGDSVRLPSNRELIRLVDGAWRLGGRQFDTVRIDCPSTIRFASGKSRSDCHGPFSNVRFIGGQVQVQNGSSHLLAVWDGDAQLWRSAFDGEAWFSVIVAQLPKLAGAAVSEPYLVGSLV